MPGCGPNRGPDLPAADRGLDVAAFRHRWPTGAEKVEPSHGHPYFYGCFDERDVEIARRAHPGRAVTLDPWDDGYAANLVVHPAEEVVCPIADLG